jgi:hypothetical protein
MREIERVVQRLGSAYHGPAWHGPALRATLEGVTPECAVRRSGSSHSIIELVLHLTTWKDVVTRRLNGENYTPDVEDDFPAAADWRIALENLDLAQERLIAAARAFEEDRLEEIVDGQEYSFAFMLHGAADHDLYHAGQIAVLKKG